MIGLHQHPTSRERIPAKSVSSIRNNNIHSESTVLRERHHRFPGSRQQVCCASVVQGQLHSQREGLLCQRSQDHQQGVKEHGHCR